jgi:hypothetical protein
VFFQVGYVLQKPHELPSVQVNMNSNGHLVSTVEILGMAQFMHVLISLQGNPTGQKMYGEILLAALAKGITSEYPP